MDKKLLLQLKSGTDVRGIAVESKNSPITLTDEAIYLIVRAFVKWLSAKSGKRAKKIAVGNDVRISGERVKAQVVKGATESGCDVIDAGLCSTPSMFMMLKEGNFDLDASIMITASHLPYDRNGLKFFTKNGGLEGKDITEILNIAYEGDFLDGNGTVSHHTYIDEYCNGLVAKVRNATGCEKPLFNKKIIVDAGNGAGGFFVEKVLAPLGADTTGSQFLEPDGLFPNHIPNPEDKTAMNAICQAVKTHGADLGIIFDTDVDRAGAVDMNGEEINRNKLIALCSAILLGDKKGTIVTDSVTSDGLAEFIEKLGGKHVRFKRGYKNVIDKAIELNNAGEYAPLAMETSGHAAFMENYFLDDGAYLITKILICLAEQELKGKTLTDLIADLACPVEADEVRLSFSDKSVDFKTEGASVIADITKMASASENMILAKDNFEGVRVNFGEGDGDGWFLVRMSVHDPIMPINFESNVVGGNKIIARKLYGILKGYAFLNTEKLKNFIE